MPKLDKDKAKEIDETESSQFAPLDEGVYYATLAEVTSGHEGPAGEYWVWRFENLINVETDAAAPGSQWVNTSLGEKSAWKMKEMFDAFRVPADTDTDELLGSDVRLVVSQRVIEKGARAGDIGNSVDRVLPLEDEEEEEPEPEPKPRAARSKAGARR